MGQIPMGNFGYRAPDPAQHTRISDDGQAASLRATQGLADTGMAIGIHERDKQQREDDAMQRVKLAGIIQNAKLQRQELMSDLENRMNAGEIEPQFLSDAYSTANEMLDKPDFSGFSPVLAQTGIQAYDQVQRVSDLQYRNLEDKGKTIQARSNVNGLIEISGKSAAAVGGNEAEVEKIVAYFNEEDVNLAGRRAYGDRWQTVKQNNIDKIRFDAAQARLQSADEEGLRKQRTDLDQGGYYDGKLDGDRMNALRASIDSRLSQIERRREQELKEKESKAKSEIEWFDERILMAQPIAAERWEQGLATVQGTPYEEQFRQLYGQADEVMKFVSKPVAEQEAMLRQMEINIKTSPSMDPKKANQRYNLFKSVMGNNINMALSDPHKFMEIRTGKKTQPLDMSGLLDPSKSGQFEKQIADRAASIDALQTSYSNKVPRQLLQVNEVKALQTLIEKSTPDQQLGLFGSLYNTVGNQANYNAIMQQLAPGSRVRAFAGNIYAKDQQMMTVQRNWFSADVQIKSSDVAKTMLEGQQILDGGRKSADGNVRTFRAPTEKDFNEAFNDYAGDGFRGRPQLAEIAKQSARAYYVGASAKVGDISEEIDSKRLREAIKATQGEVINANGRGSVFAPWGMSQDTFNKQLDKTYADLARSGGINEFFLEKPRSVSGGGRTVDVPVNQRFPRDFGLTQVGEGQYMVTAGNGQYVSDRKGKPVVINILKR